MATLRDTPARLRLRPAERRRSCGTVPGRPAAFVAVNHDRRSDRGIEIEMRLYGDDYVFRHLRVLLHTDDHHTAETCVNLNIQTWVAALEPAVMMHTSRPFTVAHFPGTLTFLVVIGVGDENSPAVFLEVPEQEPARIDYKTLGLGIGAWTSDVQHHLFYFRRHIDERFPLDVRWLNGYRLLEWHFCGGDPNLPKSREWRAFLQRFDDALAPVLRAKQTSVGLMEEARALAAHAGLDDRPASEREREPRNSLEKTFPVLERMVMTVLNEHPGRAGNPVQFRTRSSPEYRGE